MIFSSARPSPDSVRSLELRVSKADEDDPVFRRASAAKTSLHRPCLVCCRAQVKRPDEPFTRILRVVTLEDGETIHNPRRVNETRSPPVIQD